MDKVNEIMINDQKKKFEVKYIDNIDDNIIKLTNMICCNVLSRLHTDKYKLNVEIIGLEYRHSG